MSWLWVMLKKSFCISFHRSCLCYRASKVNSPERKLHLLGKLRSLTWSQELSTPTVSNPCITGAIVVLPLLATLSLVSIILWMNLLLCLLVGQPLSECSTDLPLLTLFIALSPPSDITVDTSSDTGDIRVYWVASSTPGKHWLYSVTLDCIIQWDLGLCVFL